MAVEAQYQHIAQGEMENMEHHLREERWEEL